MSKEKVIITGGTGLLGHAIVEHFKKYYVVYTTYLNHYIPLRDCTLIKSDLCDEKRTTNLIKEIKPKLIIHTAALTDVDYCEKHPEEVYDTNVKASAHIINGCKITGCDLIHISTNFLFDGEKGGYNEEDKPNPINVYAKTKHSAEKIVLNSKIRHIIIRAGIYGWNVQNKKCFPEEVISNLRNKHPINAYADQFSNPILVNHLARIIRELYCKDAHGTFHIGCDKRVSKYEFAMKIAEEFTLDKKLIIPVNSDEIKQIALRPKDTSLNNIKVKQFLNLDAIPIEKDIKEMKSSEKMYLF